MISAPLQSTGARARAKFFSFGNGLSRADAFALLAVLFWGINVAFTKSALDEIDVLAFITLRVLLSAVIAFLALFIIEHDVGVKRRDLVPLGLLGLVGVGLAQLAFILGLNFSLASHGALLLGMTPVFAALLAGWLGWDRIQKKNWFGVGICLVGLWLLTRAGGTASTGSIFLGDAVTLLSALLGAIYSVFSKRFLQAYSPLKILTYALVFSSALMLLVGGVPVLQQDWRAASLQAVITLVFSALFGTVIASILWLKSIGRIGIVRTSIYQYLLPVIGVALALALLKEELSGQQWVGAVIVMLGIFFARSR